MKQQLVEHTNRVMKWTFGALQGSLLAKAVCPPPTPLPAHSTSGAEPALATWPQLKMRKVDEKSKKFLVCPRSLSLFPLSLYVFLSFLLAASNKTKWNFQLSCQQHTPPQSRVAPGMGDSAESPLPAPVPADAQKLERCSSISSSSTWDSRRWKGAAGRHTVDTFNDYCRPLKITSKSFAHKAASGIHARQENPKGEASRDEARRNSLPNPFAIAIVDPFATVEVFSYRWLSAWQWNRKSLNSIRVNCAFLRFALSKSVFFPLGDFELLLKVFEAKSHYKQAELCKQKN